MDPQKLFQFHPFDFENLNVLVECLNVLRAESQNKFGSFRFYRYLCIIEAKDQV